MLFRFVDFSRISISGIPDVFNLARIMRGAPLSIEQLPGSTIISAIKLEDAKILMKTFFVDCGAMDIQISSARIE
ncbi:MAG TPA: hypothetical protein PLS78_02930, partial [bacterium]|nr:hypothetical protein [bacterium]